MKKILLALLLSLTLINAATLLTRNTYNVNQPIAVQFKNFTNHNKDWIAIYPANSSTAWRNVIQWHWTDNQTNGTLNFNALPAGDYEVRGFYNNSYNAEATHAFRVTNQGGGNPTLNSKNSFKENEAINITFKNFTNHHKDWIAIYPANSSTAWRNVIQWHWTENQTNGTLNFNALPVGEYEVRGFYNNSYNAETTTPFKVTAREENNQATIIPLKNTYFTNEKVSIKVHNVPELGKPRPWVGIYEVGEASTFQHLVYYQFTDQMKNGQLKLTSTKDNDPLIKYKSLTKNKVYELRLVAWVNNEYVTYARKKITIKPHPYKKEIHQAFNEHYDYHLKQMRSRLQPDKNGWVDTYELYDVQTHMQNAIIYADEQYDKEIIEKLLKLVKIPFEKQYLTNGKWLCNNKTIPSKQYQHLWGTEVKLTVSQYFSLLTRVLLAAQRQGIATNLTKSEIKIITNHITEWLHQKFYDGISDQNLFTIQSALQFANYAKKENIKINNITFWKTQVKKYMTEVLEKNWENVPCHTNNGDIVANCVALDRTSFAHHSTLAYAGYSSEITKKSSDLDPNAMFNANGIAKHPKKYLNKVGIDVSHARRYNWFFETILRYGDTFGVSIPQSKLQGWANNLAYRVCRGTIDNPKFTIFSDGVDGWYRVNYAGRKSFGYTTGDMDIHFVGSSYGIMGKYNPKIYNWMKVWVNQNKNTMQAKSSHGAYHLDYYTSIIINIKEGL